MSGAGFGDAGFRPVLRQISAAFAGAVGVFYASYVSFISPDTFVYTDSVTILAMVVLGGMGSIPGSIIAAIVLTALPEAMREFADYRMLLYAIVLIIVMLTTYNPTMRNFFQRLRPAELLRNARKKKEKSLQKEGA